MFYFYFYFYFFYFYKKVSLGGGPWGGSKSGVHFSETGFGGSTLGIRTPFFLDPPGGGGPRPPALGREGGSLGG